MRLSSLQRAGELAKLLPELRAARTMLSAADAEIIIAQGGAQVTLPHLLTGNIVAIINAEINRAEREVEKL